MLKLPVLPLKSANSLCAHVCCKCKVYDGNHLKTAHSAASNRSSLNFHVFLLHWFNYTSIWSSDKNRMLELQLSYLKANNSMPDYRMLHTETMNINVLQFQHSESFLLAVFCPAEQWNRCSVAPGSFHNWQDEIVSLVRQLTLEVCSKHILFCTFILQLPIREAI